MQLECFWMTKAQLSSVVFLFDSFPAGTAHISVRLRTLGSLLKHITWRSCSSETAFLLITPCPGFSKQALIHTVVGSCSMLLCHSPFHPFLLCYTRDTVSLTGSSAGHWTGKRHSAAGVGSVPDWDSVGCRWKAKPSKEHYHPSGTSASLSTTDLV